MNLMMSTLLATDMILDVIEGQIILHIPHSKTKIPFYDGFNMDYIENETKLLVDHDTDKIFDIPNVESLVFECNRIFCDVERLDDEDEPLFEVGRGFYYTKTDDGKDLRILNNEVKNKIKTDFYDKHHNKLIDMVEDRLNEFGSALIIDCHSFNDVPLKVSFENNNFSVKINSPYSGTIIPLKYYNKDKRVMGIMIEVNKKLYLGDEDKIIGLNHIIRKSLFS
jgi:N-formylglutamate amidohydrolase